MATAAAILPPRSAMDIETDDALIVNLKKVDQNSKRSRGQHDHRQQSKNAYDEDEYEDTNAGSGPGVQCAQQ